MSSPRTARIVIDPGDSPEVAALLHKSNRPYEGVVVVELTDVGRRTHYGLAAAVMDAFGKHLPTEGSRGDGDVAWTQASAWVAATRPEHLVVARAHIRQRDHWERFKRLADSTGAQLWLCVHGTTMSRSQKDFARDYAITTEGPEGLEASLPRPRKPSFRNERFPSVPDDAFPTFMHGCASTLTGSDLHSVEYAFWSQFDRTRDDLQAGVTDPEGWLAGIASEIGRRTAGSLDESLVRFRAVQAAAFRSGLLVGADRAALAAGYTGQPTASASDDNMRALRAVTDPAHAALAVVALCTHLAPPALAAFNVEDLDEDGQRIVVDEEAVSVPGEGTISIRAHRIVRCLQGAAGGDPLFVCEDRRDPRRGLKRTTAHGLQQQLRRTGESSGLILTNRDSWGNQQPRRWLQRRGLTITRLKDQSSC